MFIHGLNQWIIIRSDLRGTEYCYRIQLKPSVQLCKLFSPFNLSVVFCYLCRISGYKIILSWNIFVFAHNQGFDQIKRIIGEFHANHVSSVTVWERVTVQVSFEEKSNALRKQSLGFYILLLTFLLLKFLFL